MHNQTQFFKKCVGRFVGVASVGTLIVFPKMVHADIYSGSSDSSNHNNHIKTTPRTTNFPGSTSNDCSNWVIPTIDDQCSIQ